MKLCLACAKQNATVYTASHVSSIFALVLQRAGLFIINFEQVIMKSFFVWNITIIFCTSGWLSGWLRLQEWLHGNLVVQTWFAVVAILKIHWKLELWKLFLQCRRHFEWKCSLPRGIDKNVQERFLAVSIFKRCWKNAPSQTLKLNLKYIFNHYTFLWIFRYCCSLLTPD